MDQNLTCRDCQQDFVFTEGEKTFFETKGFAPPTRCKNCRAARKAAKVYQAENKES